MSCLVALDAGASEIKASVFASDGRERGGASRDCPSDAPAPGWAQCGGEVLTEWPLQVLRDAVADAGVRPDEIDAIGVTGSRATVLPIGADGSPVGPVIFWYDRRAQEESAALERTLGAERFLALTGIPLDPTPSVTKMMWLREHRPEVAAAATTYAIPQTVVLNRLAGGGWWCDESYGPYVGLMDLSSRRWSDELLAAAQVDAATLPELVAPGTVVGPLSPAAAEAAGIAAGVPVVASGSDAACFKIGAGIEETGIASIYIGTAGALGVITDRPVMDPRLTCCPSALPGYWDAEGLLLTAGSAYRWVRELVSDPERAGGPMSFAELDALAGQAPRGLRRTAGGAASGRRRHAAVAFGRRRAGAGRAAVARAQPSGPGRAGGGGLRAAPRPHGATGMRGADRRPALHGRRRRIDALVADPGRRDRASGDGAGEPAIDRPGCGADRGGGCRGLCRSPRRDRSGARPGAAFHAGCGAPSGVRCGVPILSAGGGGRLMTEVQRIADDMALYSDLLVQSGLLHLKGGNSSVRVGEDLIITRTRSFKNDLVPERLIRAAVDSDDPVEHASSVLSMHRAIYRKTEARAIIHAHPHHPALLSFYVDEFSPIDENGLIYLGRKVRVVAARRFMEWSAADEQMADALTECPAAILKWHGAFAIGDELAQAFHIMQAVETAARFYLDTWRLSGVIGTPELPEYVEPPPWAMNDWPAGSV